tara:strand:- start:731 stop:1555 length:825 start_codon:yes stop_codon:yes gene_type:complete
MFHLIESLSNENENKLNLLRERIHRLQKVCVAYSGGVDSSLVAAISKEQLGDQAIAITGISASLADHLRIEAKQQALWIGIKHQECITNELEEPLYVNNSEQRCFACKNELHKHIKEIAKVSNNSQVIDGVNHDDLGDFRPGINAAKKAGVQSPLAEEKINKIAIRQISKALGFPWWDKPAQPCLSSRFPYGEKIDAVSLKRVSDAEIWIKNKGFTNVRVRIYSSMAKIELPENEINNFILKIERKDLISYFLSLGFKSVSIDLEGFISGKLNR